MGAIQYHDASEEEGYSTMYLPLYFIFRVSPALCNVPVSVPTSKCAVHVSLSELTGQQEKSGAEIGAQKSGWRLIGEEDKEILSCRRP